MSDELTQYYFEWMSFYKDHSLLWKRSAKKGYAMYKDAEMCEQYFEKMAASRLELLKRVAEFLETNNPNHPILREIKEELAQDQADEYIESEDAHIILEVGDD